ncbi:MAG: hypothetical protein CME62_10650 [Halobacteriovoraceae bacterium]|nr:hypothetical protein [Halobacteriovoraceae bacterium]|tara:strand:- start:24417 stop:25739 length:1323 start_codon:yes stop_codon:yes gene_type:complete
MKKICALVLMTFLAAVYADDSLTIVAVGEAEKESEKISFALQTKGDIADKDKKSLNNIIKIFIEDFKFYKTIFEANEKIGDERDKSARYSVEVTAKMIDKKLAAQFYVYDVKKKEELLSTEALVNTSDLRTFAHDQANNIYKSITGKDSIFKSRIVFVSDRTSTKNEIRKELYIMDFDGERKQRLTYQNSIVISPAISPDNEKIIFTLVDDMPTRNAKTGVMMKTVNLNLYMLTLGNKRLQRISSLPGINSGAVFNKAGDHVYLTLSLGKNADIYKLNLQTKARRKITNHFAEDVDPHINFDESLMTFLSNRPGKAMIYVMDPNQTEKNVKRISFVGDYNAAPRFNPAGTEIAFSSWVDNRFDIYRIDSNGSNLVRLTKNFGSNEEPWYSPDGEFIVFSSQRVISRKKADQDLYIMNRNGEIIKKITDGYGKVFTPRWSN